MRLLLASASPRRAALLAAAGFEFEVLPVEVNEAALDGESPSAYVRRLAAEKSARALALAPFASDTLVLGADTAVVVDDELLGKPRHEADARRMLARLSGRVHEVLTGFSLRRIGKEAGGVETTRVWFAGLTPQDVDWYVRSGEGLDKAGAYAIQGLASRFIPRIEGSYSSVVGLPVAAVHHLILNFERS